ncbi:DUF3549 family protein [Alteromonas sp. A081]|uniref:DUF3549 family protein n=1 Tax=Alteromonas sp. A081 TaxID=3410269 RepID=UPI003B98789C
MSADTINSISEFLLHAGTEYKVFDIGRRLTITDNQSFLDIESGNAYAPFPRQQHVWFGIVFWSKHSSTEHYIWFVKLPTDEQGLVVTAARNHFLEIIVDALGQSILEDTEKARTLPDNPYSFVPNQGLLAQFNALVKHTLSQPLSNEAKQVEAYIQAPQLVDWQQLSMQSVADFAFSLPTHSNQNRLEEALVNNASLYSDVFLNTFMEMLEYVPLSKFVETFVLRCFFQKAEYDDINLAALRALSSNEFNRELHGELKNILRKDISTRLDVLSVIAARHYEQMDNELLTLFLTQAAKADDNEGHAGALFSGFFSDLVQIPKLRRQVLTLLRSPEHPTVLANAFNQLFAQARK